MVTGKSPLVNAAFCSEELLCESNHYSMITSVFLRVVCPPICTCRENGKVDRYKKEECNSGHNLLKKNPETMGSSVTYFLGSVCQ